MTSFNKFKFLCLGFFVSLSAYAFADIPMLRIDGSYGKTPVHQDPYNYSKLDYQAVRKNPLNIGVKRIVDKTDPNFSTLESKLKALGDWKTRDQKLREQYVKVVKTELELSEKEKKTALAYPGQFPHEAKTGKRVYVSKVMKLGNEEYSVNDCWFLGKGDMNGDGVAEIFVVHSDNATHAGAMSQIRIFSENGDFVGFVNLMTMYSGLKAVYDYDNDGRVELIFAPKHEDGKFIILGCPKNDEQLEPFSMGNNAYGDFYF